jgi:hypothetical protein
MTLDQVDTILDQLRKAMGVKASIEYDGFRTSYFSPANRLAYFERYGSG